MSHSPDGPEISLPLPYTLATEQALLSDPPAIRVQAAANYNAAQQAITKGLSYTVFKKDAIAWRQWRPLCSWLQISTGLEGIKYPIPHLHIFAERVCGGLLSAQELTIKKRLVKQYLRSIRQMFASVGADDPRHNRMGKLDFCMGCQLAYYHKEESLPTRGQPLPDKVIQALYTSAQGTT